MYKLNMSKYNPYHNREQFEQEVDKEIQKLFLFAVESRKKAEEDLKDGVLVSKDSAYVLTNLLNTHKGIQELVKRNDKDLYYNGMRGIPDNLKDKTIPQGDLFEENYVLENGSGQYIKTQQKISNKTINSQTEDILVFSSTTLLNKEVELNEPRQ